MSHAMDIHPKSASAREAAGTHQQDPSPEIIRLLQVLADSTSLTTENAETWSTLKKNITKLSEQRKKYREQSEMLRASLAEKDSLLKEVYHRVKNNLQVISSLLRLQAEKAAEPSTQKALSQNVTRVRSMALAHEMLYQSNNMARISMQDYIEALSCHLQDIHNLSGTGIRFNNRVDNIELAVDTAIPCGLIINELIANAFTHAFPDGNRGEISLSLKKGGDDILLIVSDNGTGIPEQVVTGNSQTLGLRLIHSLARQIRGTVDIQRERGTTITVRFPFPFSRGRRTPA